MQNTKLMFDDTSLQKQIKGLGYFNANLIIINVNDLPRNLSDDESDAADESIEETCPKCSHTNETNGSLKFKAISRDKIAKDNRTKKRKNHKKKK